MSIPLAAPCISALSSSQHRGPPLFVLREPRAMRSQALRVLASLSPVRLGAQGESALLFAGWPQAGAAAPRGDVQAHALGGVRALASSPDSMPLTGYMRFAVEQRPKVKEQMPDLSFTEIAKELGKRWRELSDEQKQPYNAAYYSEKKLWDEKHPKEKKAKK